MWICFNDAFLSAVEDRNNSDYLYIRARRREHLEAHFKPDEIIEMAGSDYAYRVHVTKKRYADYVRDMIMNIDYDNFKNSVDDAELHTFYNRIWFEGLYMQERSVHY